MNIPFINQLIIGFVFYSKYLYKVTDDNTDIKHLPITVIAINQETNVLTVNYGSNDDDWNLEHCIWAFERYEYAHTDTLFRIAMGLK